MKEKIEDLLNRATHLVANDITYNFYYSEQFEELSVFEDDYTENQVFKLEDIKLVDGGLEIKGNFFVPYVLQALEL